MFCEEFIEKFLGRTVPSCVEIRKSTSNSGNSFLTVLIAQIFLVAVRIMNDRRRLAVYRKDDRLAGPPQLTQKFCSIAFEDAHALYVTAEFHTTSVTWLSNLVRISQHQQGQNNENTQKKESPADV